MSDTIQSAETLAYKLRETKPNEGLIIWPEMVLDSQDARITITRRDAAIRADEARKQAERYAACVEAQGEYIKLLLEELEETVPIAANHNWHSTRFEKGEIARERIAKALANLEAPK
jgi:hypothetical protein